MNVDFVSQIEAHFGVKPKHADDISYFIGGSSSSADVEINNLMFNRPSDMTTDHHPVMTSYELRGGLPDEVAPAGKTFIGEATNGQTFGKSTERFRTLYGSLSSSGSSPLGASLSVAALRQAYAAQKYKEIQLANDVDFASQIEAHFGVKPKHADDTSYFIGGIVTGKQIGRAHV